MLLGDEMSNYLRKVATAAAGATAIGVLSLSFFASAGATEGYFANGFGVRQSALAGAGVADSRDAMALSLNPAGLVDVSRQFQAGIGIFMPTRDYTGTGTALVAPGSFESNNHVFAVPNMAYSNAIDATSSWGWALYGNGGMNTTWGDMRNTSAGCAMFGGNPGVFCGGRAGVDLMQAFLSAGYAKRMGAFSLGIAPVIAIQRFKATGLSAFANYSSDPNNLTDKGYDYSFGGGVRVGVQWNVAPNVRLGLAGQSPMWMTDFDKYRGLFAGSGDFDIPGALTAGVAWDATPALTLMFDYKHIFYSSIASVGNSGSVIPVGSLGTASGPGFGWRDVDAFKFGAEWRMSPVWTWRLGYSHNTNPIKSSEVTLNILAPGVVTDHFTGGFSYALGPGMKADFAAMYVPKHRVSGTEVLPQGFVAVPGTVTLEMHQLQFSIGLTYQFDAAPAPLVRKN